MILLQCGDIGRQCAAVGHQPPRQSSTGAAASPLIVLQNPDAFTCRVRR
jgi:hypothetical protein